MLGRVVDDVAALAQRAQVSRRAITEIVVEVGTGEDDICRPHNRQGEALNGDTAPLVIAPETGSGVPPAAIAQVRHIAHVRAAALLTPGAGSVEADRLGDLLPVDRVQPTVFGADRHRDSMSQVDPEWKL